MSVPRVLRASLAALAVTLSVAPSVAATSGTPTYEGPGAASPEDAVTTYMDGLAAADLDAMVSSFAIETYVDNFDMRAYLERIQIYQLGAMPLYLPPDSLFTEALAVEQRHDTVFHQVLFQALRLVDPDLEPTEGVSLTDPAELEEFYNHLAAAAAALDTSEAASFTFVPLAEVDAEAAEDYESEQNQTNLDELSGILGADEMTDLVVRFTVGGREFFAFFSVVRYGDAWWVAQLGGNFAQLVGISTLEVGAVPVDEDADTGGSSSTSVEPRSLRPVT